MMGVMGVIGVMDVRRVTESGYGECMYMVNVCVVGETRLFGGHRRD